VPIPLPNQHDPEWGDKMNKLWKDKDWLYQKYVVEKLNQTEMAKLVGVASSTIRKHLIKNDIPIRSLSETLFLCRKNPPITISDEMMEFIQGNVLGDGGIFSVSDKKNIQRTASYSHSSKYLDIVLYIKSVFEKNNIETMGKINRFVHKKSGAVYYQYWTKHYVELLDIRRYMYKNGKKIIPRDLELTPTIVLHWYIGDGSLSKCSHNKKYVRICSEGFPIEDVEFVVEKFCKMGLTCTRQPSCNTIRFATNKTGDFLDFVGPCPEEIEHIYGYKFDY